MSKENGFVPIDEAYTDRIRFVPELPYVDRKQIGVNVQRIQGLMDLGGIEHLRVQTVEKEEESFSPTIVGFDSQGGAYAGKTSSKTKRETHEYENKTYRDGGIFSSPVANLTINLNTIEIADRISRKEGIRSTDAWSKEIDRIIKKGIRESGTRVLTVENWKNEIGGYLGYFIVAAPRYITGNISLTEIPSFLSIGVFLNTLHVLVNRERRMSLFYGPQLDRAALLQLRTRTKKIVAAIDADE